jgi:hypothetical protein
MNGALDAVADELRGTTPAQLDLTIGDHLDQLHSAADRLLDQRGFPAAQASPARVAVRLQSRVRVGSQRRR